MKINLFGFECLNCKVYYRSPETVGTYGEFIMNSPTGYHAYLEAILSDVYKEVSNFVRWSDSLLDKSLRSDVLQEIFGIACDLAPDGSRYSITQKPVCPDCKKCNIGSWGPRIPVEIVDMDIPRVTHNHWNSLSFNEKRDLVDDAIVNVLPTITRSCPAYPP